MKPFDIDKYLFRIRDVRTVKALLDAGADTNAKSNGMTALMMATKRDNKVLVKMLLDHDGINANMKDNRGRTAFMYTESEEMTIIFLSHPKVDKNAEDIFGETILIKAVEHGDMEKVGILLKFGVDVNVGDRNGMTPLMYAKNRNITEMLLRHGANINAQDDIGCTALIWAVDKNSIEIVKLLLENNADVNIRDEDGKTALATAIWRGHYRIIELLKNRK